MCVPCKWPCWWGPRLPWTRACRHVGSWLVGCADGSTVVDTGSERHCAQLARQRMQLPSSAGRRGCLFKNMHGARLFLSILKTHGARRHPADGGPGCASVIYGSCSAAGQFSGVSRCLFCDSVPRAFCCLGVARGMELDGRGSVHAEPGGVEDELLSYFTTVIPPWQDVFMHLKRLPYCNIIDNRFSSYFLT